MRLAGCCDKVHLQGRLEGSFCVCVFYLFNWGVKDFKLPSVLRSGLSFKTGTQKGDTPPCSLKLRRQPLQSEIQPTFHKCPPPAVRSPSRTSHLDSGEAGAASTTMWDLSLTASCRKRLGGPLCTPESSVQDSSL